MDCDRLIGKIVCRDAAEFGVLLHVIGVVEEFAQEIRVHSVPTGEIQAFIIWAFTIYYLGFVACGEFRGTLLAAQPHRVPPILNRRKKRQLVCCPFTPLNLLEKPTPFVVGEVFVF